MAVFAATGALGARRKQMDIIGFALLAALTGLGGGTVRDLILNRPVFWLRPDLSGDLPWRCESLFLRRPYDPKALSRAAWLDAIGLAAYGVLGAHVAFDAGMIVAMAPGVVYPRASVA